MTLHFIHIGKTGGTAMKRGLRRSGRAYWADAEADQVLATPYGPIKLHGHGPGGWFTLQDVPPGDHAFFFLRDPVDRFVSAFYSRQAKGQPRHYYEWSETERRVFEAFDTPQQLAMALLSADEAERSLAHSAFRHIRHMRPVGRAIGTPRALRSRLRQVVYIGRQETMDGDWAQLKRLLELPPETKLPQGPTRAHRRDPSLKAPLDEAAVAALRDWYRADYLLLDYCERVRSFHGWGTDPADGARSLGHRVTRLRDLPAVLPVPAQLGRLRRALR